MRVRRHAALLSVALLGCPARTPAPPPETAPAVPDPAPADAAVTPAADAAIGDEVVLCTDAPTCLPPHRETLRQSLREAESDPMEAQERLASLPLPVAFAWRAYLHQAAGQTDEAARLLELLGAARPRDPVPTQPPAGADPNLVRALTALRGHTEALLGSDPAEDAPLVPCWLFARHTPEALYAFGPVHGSTLDALMAAHQRRCVTAVAHDRLGDIAPAALAAADALSQAVRSVRPPPTEGTLFHALAIEHDQRVLRPLLLGPTPAETSPAAAPLRAQVAAAARQDRGVTARFAAFQRARATHAPAYGRGLCAARPATPALSPAQCTALGAAEVDRALGDWLRAIARATAEP